MKATLYGEDTAVCCPSSRLGITPNIRELVVRDVFPAALPPCCHGFERTNRTSQTSRKFRGCLPRSAEESRQHRRKQKQLRLPSFSTAFRVEVTGSTLMAPAPPRPGQGTFHIARHGPDESCKQMTRFRNREGKQGKCRRVRVWQHDRERMRLFPSHNPSKVGSRQHHQRLVAIPTNCATRL